MAVELLISIIVGKKPQALDEVTTQSAFLLSLPTVAVL